jgi:hypothetical protein
VGVIHDEFAVRVRNVRKPNVRNSNGHWSLAGASNSGDQADTVAECA